MRQILFQIPLDRPWSFGPLGKWPVFGFGLLLLAWAVFGIWHVVTRIRRGGKFASDDGWDLARWTAVSFLLIIAPKIGEHLRVHGTPAFQDGLPIFGYGFMMMIALMSGVWLASRRIARFGVHSDLIYDLAFWLFLPGILGARLFYIVQYHNRVFENVRTLDQFLYTLVSLWNGGIVLYGGLIGAAVSFFIYCHLHRIRPLALLDVITPSIFLGIGFGRIGCFLNGCCYGDPTNLPWGVQFPKESATFGVLLDKGLVRPDDLCTPPLHPSQLYSAIDGFVIALITHWYFSRKRRNGEVFAIGMLIYPVTRFLIEFVRGDEPGMFGTRFTISQWISMIIFAVGIAYVIWLSRRPATIEPLFYDPVGATKQSSNSLRPVHAGSR